MPPGKRAQSNAMLYTVVTFVGLFIAAAAAAVLLYIKFEEQKTLASDLEEQRNQLATASQVKRIDTIVGPKKSRETYIGKMVGYLDETAYLIIGGVPEDTSAEIKVGKVDRAVQDMTELVAEYIAPETFDVNTSGLLRLTEKLKTQLDNTTSSLRATQGQLDELDKKFNDMLEANSEKEKELLAQKEKYKQRVEKIQSDYTELQALMRQTTEQQIQTLRSQLQETRDDYENLNEDLLKTRAELKLSGEMMDVTQAKLRRIVPKPDSEVEVFKSDGKVMLVDHQTNIVHLNIGSDDRVYRGLTFSVYDRTTPIPRDGVGKAEIEVFDVGKTFSAARVIRSQIKRPIVADDVIANLIWDSDQTNMFVVAGEFDLDDNGSIDHDAIEKIEALIEKWGGAIGELVSIQTDFLVLGSEPHARRRPTFEEMETYPMAMQRYEDSLKRASQYKEIVKLADVLQIPVLSYERFLYLIGYKTQAGRPEGFK
ncbi:hypothetical protein ACFL3G_08060 [Planctomycetota bacterium]